MVPDMVDRFLTLVVYPNVSAKCAMRSLCAARQPAVRRDPPRLAPAALTECIWTDDKRHPHLFNDGEG